MKRSELNRRAFLHMTGGVATAATLFGAGALERVQAAGQSVADKTPQEVAKDEFYWREIQLAFRLDRTLINMNNGFTCPMPRVSIEAVARYMDMINMLPVHYQGQVASNVQTIRRRMANEFGCDPEEMALTRGASEALQIVQNGLDL
jgi:selenocysteine lyase/cysteine desulfurase